MSIADLTPLELEHVLVVLRLQRERMIALKVELEEKVRLGWNGVSREAVMLCDNELHLLHGIIAKMMKGA